MLRNVSKVVIVIALFVIVLVAIDGYCEGSEAEFVYPRGTLKIGVAGPMTGVLASEGKEFVHGVTMAVEELNARGGLVGYKLEIVVGDAGSDFEAGRITSAYEKLITVDKVEAIFTGYTHHTQFEVEICREYNMIYFIAADAMSTERIIGAAPEKYPTIFNAVPSYIGYRTELPKRMEEWAKKGLIELPNREVVIITSDNAYSRYISEGLRENFEAIGWEITLYEMVAFGTVTEWGPILSKIRVNPPALIANIDYIPANNATLMEQFLESPTNSHMFMQYGPSTPEFIELLGDKSDGVLYNAPTLTPWVKKYGQGVALLEKYKDRWGYEPGMYGLYLYTNVMIWANAVERVGCPKDRVAVGENIKYFTAYWGPQGLLTFDPKTHLMDSKYAVMTFYQIWDGKRYVIDPEEYMYTEIRMPLWWLVM